MTKPARLIGTAEPNADWKDHVQRGLAYALDARLAPHYERHLVDDCRYQTPDVVADALARMTWPRSAFASGTAPLWLDVGAGSGLVGKAVAQSKLDIDLVALDLSQAMLELIDCPRYVERRCADVTAALPFGDASFDGVLGAGLLEHLIDPAPLFRSAARVLKPAGGLLFTFPPNCTGRAELFDREEGLVSHDPVSIRACLESIGFSVAHELDYPAYLSGSRGWVIHHLMVGVQARRGAKEIC